MKKLISFVCSLVILGVSAFSCFASTDSFKDQILSALKSGAYTGVTTLYLPQEYLNQAENYLNSNESSLTEEQTQKILANINDVKKTIAQTNATSFAEIENDSATFEKIKTSAEQAASEAGLKLTFNGSKSITITDSNGNVVFKTSIDGNSQTGFNGGYQQATSNTNNIDKKHTDKEQISGNEPAEDNATTTTYEASENDVIKTTGLGVNVTNAAVVSSVIGLLLLASGAVIYNNKLFKHE